MAESAGNYTLAVQLSLIIISHACIRPASTDRSFLNQHHVLTIFVDYALCSRIHFNLRDAME